jgi:hypothetical protein
MSVLWMWCGNCSEAEHTHKTGLGRDVAVSRDFRHAGPLWPTAEQPEPLIFNTEGPVRPEFVQDLELCFARLRGLSNQGLHLLTDRYCTHLGAYDSNQTRQIELHVGIREHLLVGIPSARQLAWWQARYAVPNKSV